MTAFNNWIDRFIDEKGIDLDETMTVDGPSGPNLIPVSCVVQGMKRAPRTEQSQIRDVIVAIDFKNGDVLHFIRHLAKAIAI